MPNPHELLPVATLLEDPLGPTPVRAEKRYAVALHSRLPWRRPLQGAARELSQGAAGGVSGGHRP